MLVIKKNGKVVKAYRLGEDNPVILQFINEGKIKKTGDGIYELFSKEAVNGKGQVAYDGYYARVDSDGYVYPNSDKYVAENLRHISGDDYEVVPTAVKAWEVSEGMIPEIDFLIANKGLVIDESCYDKYFSAPLWGTILSAAKNAVIIFYSIKYNDDGSIDDIDFNFVEREEFERTYNILNNQVS